MVVKYDALSRAPIPKRLLVVGSPRSGTQFISSLLNRFGLRVRHERMGEDGTVNAAWLAMRQEDDSLIQVTGRQHYEFEQIVHLIRHPIATITSLAAEIHPVFWDWQLRHSLVEVDPADLDSVAQFWVFWTDGCQKLCDSHVRLEDIAHLGQRRNEGMQTRLEVKTADFSNEIETLLRNRCERYGYTFE